MEIKSETELSEINCYNIRKFIYKIKKEYETLGKSKLYDYLCDKICATKNPYFCFRAAEILDKADISKFEEVVLLSKSPEYNYLFAMLPNAKKMKEHEKIVIESKNSIANFFFAKNVKNADIKTHISILEENGDIYYLSLLKEKVKREIAYLTAM